MAGKSRSLGSLLVNVGADTRALETGLKSATQDVSTFGNKTQSTARKAEGSLTKMGRGGFAISQGFSGLGKILPALGGAFGIGSIAGMAMGSIREAADEAAAVSPAIAAIRARREQFKFKKALARGEKNPRATELMAGGFSSNIGSGFANVFDVIAGVEEGGYLGNLPGNLAPLFLGGMENFLRGFLESQEAAEDGGFLPIDQARLDRNRLELFGPAPVAGTGSGSSGSGGGK